jgi:putative acetyltransferase
MTTAVSVRVMRPDEWPAARTLCIDAFDDAGMPPLLDMLRTSWSWIDELAFVAERADVPGELVGMVLFSHAFVDAPDRIVDVLVLSPVGVRPDLQRTGVGDALLRHALATIVATRPEPLVFLEGHPGYYPRFGFQLAGDMGFTAPSVRIPHRAFMAYPLPSYEPSVCGALVYPDAFWRTDSVGLRP